MKNNIQIYQIVDSRFPEYKAITVDQITSEIARQLIENKYIEVKDEYLDDNMRIIKVSFIFDDLKGK